MSPEHHGHTLTVDLTLFWDHKSTFIMFLVLHTSETTFIASSSSHTSHNKSYPPHHQCQTHSFLFQYVGHHCIIYDHIFVLPTQSYITQNGDSRAHI